MGADKGTGPKEVSKMKDWLTFLKRNWPVVMIGTVLRLIPAPFTGHPYDMGIWWITGRFLSEGKSPYSPYDHLGQPVVFGIWMLLSFLVAVQFPSQLHVFALLMKLPLLLTDLFLPFYVLNLCRKYGVTVPVSERRFFAVLFLNPLSILITGFWAMPDLISLLLVLGAIDRVIENREIQSSFFLSLSIGIKLYPVILMVPLMILVQWRSGSIMRTLRYGALTTVLFLAISYLPFFIFGWNPAEITGVLTSQTNRAYGTLSPFHSLILLSYSYPWPQLLQIVQFIQENTWLGFLWMIGSFLLFSTLLIIGKDISGAVTEDFSFHFIITLMIVAYSLWMATASWVSEQNTIAWLTLVLIRVQLDDDWKNLILAQLCGFLVVGFAVFNLPFFKFLYLTLAPIEVFNLNQPLVQVRNLSLGLLGSAFYIAMMIIGIDHLRKLRTLITYWKKVF